MKGGGRSRGREVKGHTGRGGASKPGQGLELVL